MRKDHNYRVECDCGQSYTQTIESTDDTGMQNRPFICGICGSYDIRVWHLIYDGLSPVVMARIQQEWGDYKKELERKGLKI